MPSNKPVGDFSTTRNAASYPHALAITKSIEAGESLGALSTLSPVAGSGTLSTGSSGSISVVSETGIHQQVYSITGETEIDLGTVSYGGTTSFTVELICTLPAAREVELFSIGVGGNSTLLVWQFGSLSLTIGRFASGQVSVSPSFSATSAYVHIFLVVDFGAGTYRLTADGATLASGTLSLSLPATSETFYIPIGESWNGGTHRVAAGRFYSRAITLTEEADSVAEPYAVVGATLAAGDLALSVGALRLAMRALGLSITTPIVAPPAVAALGSAALSELAIAGGPPASVASSALDLALGALAARARLGGAAAALQASQTLDLGALGARLRVAGVDPALQAAQALAIGRLDVRLRALGVTPDASAALALALGQLGLRAHARGADLALQAAQALTPGALSARIWLGGADPALQASATLALGQLAARLRLGGLTPEAITGLTLELGQLAVRSGIRGLSSAVLQASLEATLGGLGIRARVGGASADIGALDLALGGLGLRLSLHGFDSSLSPSLALALGPLALRAQARGVEGFEQNIAQQLTLGQLRLLLRLAGAGAQLVSFAPGRDYADGQTLTASALNNSFNDLTARVIRNRDLALEALIDTRKLAQRFAPMTVVLPGIDATAGLGLGTAGNAPTDVSGLVDTFVEVCRHYLRVPIDASLWLEGVDVYVRAASGAALRLSVAGQVLGEELSLSSVAGQRFSLLPSTPLLPIEDGSAMVLEVRDISGAGIGVIRGVDVTIHLRTELIP